ncbi:GNAT family N-acetyltransferase [Bowmanella dokdonensis]|uniref:N-acetyltransferase n=1 Tax=Bowmanella dokdonensis TaxID=751969 RepID=A0A939IP93_9ALTE|nr:GNAT family N-acetyltransferase [Bowmanella dokdonensis]MBN7827203.1 N-acetyltransferase [Bowmanella dokdonensis]
MAKYPLEVSLDNGKRLIIRPICPQDAELEQDFVRHLSAQSKHFRFMANIRELSPQMLKRFTNPDPEKEMALVAMVGEGAEQQEVGVCRYIVNRQGDACEFAVVVADAWQHHGVGWHLMTELIRVARERGLSRMEGQVLANNVGMLQFCRNLGFRICPDPSDRGSLSVIKDLISKPR